MDFKMSPMDARNGWEIFINGEKDDDLKVVEISSQYGKLRFGRRPEGFNGWSWQETGGGGAITLPFARTENGDLLIGLLIENRLNMGGEALCIVGGFIDPGEKHDVAQVREAEEETGIDTARAVEMPGPPSNGNRLYFVADFSQGEGIHTYALEVPFSSLKENGDGHFVFAEQYDKLGKAAKVVFMPWHEAVRKSPDMMARAAIAQLLAMEEEAKK